MAALCDGGVADGRGVVDVSKAGGVTIVLEADTVVEVEAVTEDMDDEEVEVEVGVDDDDDDDDVEDET